MLFSYYIKILFKGIDMATELTECPYCGHDEYYRVVVFSGESWWRYKFNGEETDNSGYWDSCKERTLRTMYCCECNKRVGIKGK